MSWLESLNHFVLPVRGEQRFVHHLLIYKILNSKSPIYKRGHLLKPSLLDLKSLMTVKWEHDENLYWIYFSCLKVLVSMIHNHNVAC